MSQWLILEIFHYDERARNSVDCFRRRRWTQTIYVVRISILHMFSGVAGCDGLRYGNDGDVQIIVLQMNAIGTKDENRFSIYGGRKQY